MRVLVVEDSHRLRRSVLVALRASGYAVDDTSDGAEALWMIENNDYDVVILDIMLPGLDGLSILRRVRGRGRNIQVIFVTARDAVEDRVLGLRSGADDYLVKPFALEELIARVEALTRRAYGMKSTVLRVGPLELDLKQRGVRSGGRAVALTPREYALLEYLALRHEQLVTRPEIEAHIYDQNAELMSNVVDSTISSLRRKLDRPGEPSMIQTRRGFGYVLQPAGEMCPPSAGE